jgi:hypothetical protein
MKIICTFIFTFYVHFAFGQTVKDIELLSLKKLFRKEMSSKSFKDTNMTYLFAFKVDVRKDHNKIAIVNKISASDSSAYAIYPHTDFLRKINYSIFMGNKNNCSFILPVAIFLQYPGVNKELMVSSDIVAKQMVNYMFLSGTGVDPTYDWIYIPTIILRTSTVISQ